MAADLPDPSSPTVHFGWSWRAHQALEGHLGKPDVTLDDVRTLWSA